MQIGPLRDAANFLTIDRDGFATLCVLDQRRRVVETPVKVVLVKALGLVAACCVAGSSITARADAFVAGVVVRTDRATQSTRISSGVEYGKWAVRVVVDPQGYRRTGEQSDTDVVAELDVWRGWSVFGGWRVGVVPVLGTHCWQHHPFAGVSAPLPSLMWGHVQTRFGAELSVTALEHGDGLATMTHDTLGWGLFLRAEWARGF